MFLSNDSFIFEIRITRIIYAEISRNIFNKNGIELNLLRLQRGPPLILNLWPNHLTPVESKKTRNFL